MTQLSVGFKGNENMELTKGKLEVLMVCLVLAIMSTLLSGCGMLGVQNVELWKGGPRMEFASGQDFHIGANSIDQVDNKRALDSRKIRHVTVKE